MGVNGFGGWGALTVELGDDISERMRLRLRGEQAVAWSVGRRTHVVWNSDYVPSLHLYLEPLNEIFRMF